MATEIINLELTELSLVGKGANQFAKAPIFKADDGDVEKMTDDQAKELDKMSSAMKKKMNEYMKGGMSYDDAKKRCKQEMTEKMEEENQRLRKALLDNGFVIKADAIEKKVEEESVEYDGETITKSDDRYELVMKLKAKEEAERDAQIEKQVQETLPNWDADVAKSILKMDIDEKVLAALKAADAAFEAVMTEKGQSDVDGDLTDPMAALEKRQEELMEQKGISKQAAFAEISKTAEGRAMINKAYYEKD